MDKVVVGMSGGVDSAVCALLLKQAGYDVIGVTLRTWQADDGSEGRCCDIDDARDTARVLGIPYYPVNCTFDFKREVVDPFVSDYLRGQTPNPCIRCNRYVKWEKLLAYAAVTGARYVATGHYASIVRTDSGRYTLKRAQYAPKDQTYMLYRLTQEQLAKTLMPLGKLTKDDVRALARRAGLPVAEKPDSQEVCFVADDRYADYIEGVSPGGCLPAGDFVDEAGRVLGRHRGVARYTVGQRKGLGAFGRPMYVKEIRAEINEVVLSDEAALYRRVIECRDACWMSVAPPPPGAELTCFARIRYLHREQPARVTVSDEGRVRLTFDDPVRAATPGQSAVFYDADGCVLGGGIIEKAVD
ncbi:MAG: tRNA 2-thiouridine(34) synthase MnmA [Clostridia bacterium]|nr:tRNA 2-thiouridine(34) synthase MnmA [Clostridia bacterium]